MTKGRKFWLSGDYDRESVEACPYHPAHHWIVVRLGDVLEHPDDPDERMVFCKGCYVPRCGGAGTNPCILPRHHPERHLRADGTYRDVGHYPLLIGDEQPSLPALLADVYDDLTGLPTTAFERSFALEYAEAKRTALHTQNARSIYGEDA